MSEEHNAGAIRNVADILRDCPHWGIPHFQRGLVWDDDAVSLLLESLYYDTPIGSFVLWQCRDQTQGIPWLRDERFDHLIVDGQQRTRSLYGALGGGPARADGGGRLWCVNLRATAECRAHFGRRPKELPLFVNVLERYRPPQAEGHAGPSIPSRFQRDLIELQALLWDSGCIEAALGDPRIAWAPGDQHVRRRALEDLAVRLKEMLERQVFVRVEPECSLDRVVAIYNRINCAGKRVEAAERAFAMLVAIDPPSSDAIRGLFQAVHGTTRSPGMERDCVLKRQKERSFGFSLFVRTFVQVCAYHFGSQSKSLAFSFDYVWSDDFSAKARALGPEQFRELWRTVEEAIRFVHNVLREELGCDDLRFLPETSSLVPVFQLLIRYPGLVQAGAKTQVAALILHLYLAECTQAQIMKMVGVANNPQLRHAADAIAKMRAGLRVLTKGSLATRLSSANSLQDRYALMLYWLERSRGARDFSYGANRGRLAKPDSFRGPEMVLDRAAEAEKQHIVPYSVLKEGIYRSELGSNARVGTHAANNVGNLTYISQRLNSYEVGIGENRLLLDDEPLENRQAHLLAGVEPGEDTEAAFEAFCRERRDAMADGFLQWFAALATAELVGVEACQVPPEPPRHAIGPLEDEVRRLGLDGVVEERLIAVVPLLKRVPLRKGATVGLQMVKDAVVAVTVLQSPAALRITPRTSKLLERFQAGCPSVPWKLNGDVSLESPESVMAALDLLREFLLAQP